MSALTLPQRLALVRYLTDRLAALRKGDLLPQAAAEMPPGARLPVMFGGKLAGWAAMPKAAVKVTVTDDAALLAWAQKNQPGHVGTLTEVVVSKDLVAYLAEHAPQFLEDTPVLDEQWVSDVTTGLKNNGAYITAEGEKLTEIPGIEVGETEPVPRVTFTEDADAVIAAAWQTGDIAAADLLALPAGTDGAP